MLSMSKRADYALLALTHLAVMQAGDPKRLVNTKEIAEQYEIPGELLAKILQTLAKNGIVASHPGPTGGYKLLRAPAAISVAEVLTVLDGPLSILQCSNGHGASCKQFNRCTIRDPLAEIERRVKNLLQDMTLEDISGLASADSKWPRFEDYSARRFAVGLPLG